MDCESAKCVAMMSIKPQFAFRLLSGEKRVEFRRRPTAKRLTHIVVYATRPIGGVVGVLEVEGLTQGTPRELWQAYADVGGIGQEDFFNYFSGATRGVAYVIRTAWSCTKAHSLGKSGLPKVPPQAVKYLHPKTVSRFRYVELTGEISFEAWLSRLCQR